MSDHQERIGEKESVDRRAERKFDAILDIMAQLLAKLNAGTPQLRQETIPVQTPRFFGSQGESSRIGATRNRGGNAIRVTAARTPPL